MMRNLLLTSGVSFKTMARPKTKEIASTGNLQPKEGATTDFQTMLHTVYGEQESHGNQGQDGKFLKVKPENHSPRPEQSIKGSKPALSKTEKSDIPPQDVPEDGLTDEQQEASRQSDEERSLLDVSPKITTGMPLNVAQKLPVETVVEATISNLPTVSAAANQAVAPASTPTPTPTPEITTKFQPSLVAAQLDLTIPVNPGIGNEALSALNSANPAIKPPISTSPQTAVLPGMNVFGDTGNIPAALVAEPLPMAVSDDLMPTPATAGTAAPQTGNTLSQPVIPTGVGALTAAANLATVVQPTTLTPTPEAGADQSQVSPGPGSGAIASSVQTCNANEPAPKLVPTVADQPVQTVQPVQAHTPINVAGNTDPGNRIIDPDLILRSDSTAAMSPVTAATTIDLNPPVNLNTVMAGASLQKNGTQAGNTSVLLTTPAIAAPMEVLFNAGNRLTKPEQGAVDTGNGAEVKIGVTPAETVGQDQTPTGMSQTAIRRDPTLNSSDSAVNLQLAPAAESTTDTAQVGLNLGVTGKTLVKDEVKPAQTAKIGAGRDTDHKTGKTTLELPGATAVAAQDNVIQTGQTVNQREVSAVNKSEIFTQIVEQAKVMIHQGQSEMELSLKPEHLGKLKMKIAVEHQIVTAQFIVESEQVKQIIETNLVQLRKLLQDAGAQVENLTVTVGQHDTGSNLAQQSNSGGPGNNRSQPQDITWASTKETPNHSEGTRAPTRSKASIDLIA
jgi:hypothetical protein